MLPLGSLGGYRAELPPEGRLFPSEDEMTQFIKSFCKQQGYEAIIKGRSDKRTSVYWICKKWKDGCPVKWRSTKKNDWWAIRHSNPDSSHNHPVGAPRLRASPIQLF